MKKTLSAAAVCAALTPVSSLVLVSEANAAVTINGYVRLAYVAQEPDQGDSVSRFDYRGRINLFSEDQTSFGKMRSTLRLQGTDGTSGTTDANYGVDRALIELGNFRVGYSDSWETTYHGYGNPIERNDGDYGFDQAFLIDYSGTIGGFSYGVGIQDTDAFGGTTNTDFDPYFGLGFNVAGFGIKASYVNDSENSEGQIKISASGAIAGFNFNLWHRDQTGPNRYGSGADLEDAAGPVLSEVSSSGLGFKYTMSPRMAFGFGYSTNDNKDSGDVAATLFWTPVEDLQVRPEVVFADDDTFEFGVRMYRRF